MWKLLNYRIWIALALSLALFASHYKAYTIGGARVTSAWAVERANQAQELARFQAAAQSKAQEIQANARKVTNDYIAQKNARAVDAVRSADRLRDYQGALARLTSADRDSATNRRIDETVARIAGECAVALGTVDESAKQYRGIAEALQSYTREVCLKQ